MNKAHAIWTLLPNGYVDQQRDVVNLALIVSLRVATDSGRLGDLPGLLDWPALVRSFDTVNVLVDGASSPVQASVASQPASSQVWKALFGPSTTVRLEGGGEVSDLAGVGSSVLYKPLNRALRAIYEGTTAGKAATDGAARRGAEDGPLPTALSGLANWRYSSGPATSGPATSGPATSGPAADARAQDDVEALLDPTAVTATSLDRAAELLREQGRPDAAEVLPLVSVLRRLRGGASRGGKGTRSAASGAAGPGTLAGTRTADEADFHQILGLASAHPALAVPLGLRIDLTMPLSPGPHRLQVVGLPMQISGGAPVSNVVADRSSGRFVMATQQGAPTEIVNGMLDLRPDGPGAEKYVITTMDVVGMTQQLDALARNLAPGAAPTLPVRRNVGITVAQVDRRATTVAHTIERGTMLADGFGRPDSVDLDLKPTGAAARSAAGAVGGEVDLFADDVTAGYRVDVRTDRGEWRSLMRRTVSYRVGEAASKASPPITLTADDEGVLDPMVAVEQPDANGAPAVEIGEDLFTFDGYSLVAKRPGPALSTRPDGSVVAELPETGSAPYPLAMKVAVKPGTVPRLRYGSEYEFRIRATDLAGNSIAPELCEPRLVSAPVVYRRLDPVPAPHLQLRAPLTAGESLLQLVVRTDGDDDPIGGVCERHLAAPRAWFELAERHGRFDDAMGRGSTPQSRERMLAVAALEAGSFTDLTVPDPADPTGPPVPAEGLRIAVNADEPDPPTGSLEGLGRGVPLPAGEYVVVDDDDPALPWLADPLAAGVAVAGLASTQGETPVQLRYGGQWPVPTPVRLVARPGKGTAPSGAVSTSAGGRQVLTISVPPAATVTAFLSSTLDEAGLDVMEIDLPASARQGALAGQEPLLTPAQPITIVHAVRRPVTAPTIIAPTVAARKAGDTTAVIGGTAQCHPASTAQIDVVARWNEILDDGRTAARTVTAGKVTVAADQPSLAWEVRQSFGDTKRRDIEFAGRGTSRFREYFAPNTPAEQLTREGAGVTAIVPNTAHPEAPVVDLAVPLFAWERKLVGGVLTSTRRTAGLRLWLTGPWFGTGTGERLGVVVYRDQAAGSTAIGTARHQRVSRWAGSSTDGVGSFAPHLTKEHFPGQVERIADRPASGQEVLGFPVHRDPESGRWFSDVQFDLGSQLSWFPFLRLAVVRFQPESAPGCHVSPVVVTLPVQLPPKRTMIAWAAGPEHIDVAVTGPWMNHTVFDVALSDRVVPGSDIYQEAPSPQGTHQSLSPPGRTTRIVSTGRVSLRRSGTAGGAVDRIVVRELERGDHTRFPGDPLVPGRPGPANRTIWMETVDTAPLLAAPPAAPPSVPAPGPPLPTTQYGSGAGVAAVGAELL